MNFFWTHHHRHSTCTLIILVPISCSVPKERIHVQLQDELSESLRLLKPEGNLLKDRFQSIVERNLIEPRVPVAYVTMLLSSLACQD